MCIRDRCSASLKCTLEDSGESNHVVYLVRKITSSGTDHSEMCIRDSSRTELDKVQARVVPLLDKMQVEKKHDMLFVMLRCV